MMSSETACFNGYAEEFLEVQMADAMPFQAIYRLYTTRYGKTHSVSPYCSSVLLDDTFTLTHEPLMKARDMF